MYSLIMILAIIAGVLMIIVVLAQNPKGGGLTSGFTGVNQLLGAKSGTNLFEKMTWGTAIVIVALSLIAASTLGSGNKKTKGPAKTMVDKDVTNSLKNNKPNQKFTPAPGTNEEKAKESAAEDTKKENQ